MTYWGKESILSVRKADGIYIRDAGIISRIVVQTTGIFRETRLEDVRSALINQIGPWRKSVLNLSYKVDKGLIP